MPRYCRAPSINTIAPILQFSVLPSAFFNADTITVAKSLLGKFLVHKTSLGTMVGRIVETEAYLADDPACHAHGGKKTGRTEIMFGPPGVSYIYLVYGMHYCFNVVTRETGIGEAVLIRALEPVAGIEVMQENRNTAVLKNLCSGPGKLVSAMGMDKSLNGVDLTKKPLYLAKDPYLKKVGNIVTTTRIGISHAKALPLRFYLENNTFISKK